MNAPARGPAIRELEEGIHLIPSGKAGGSHVYLLRGARRNALVDLGMPADHAYLCENLAHAGLALDDIDLVILTHEHFDHVGDLPNMPARTLVAAHSRAANKLQLDDQFSTMSGAFHGGHVAGHVDILLEDGALIDLGGLRLRTIYTPGHCSGAICLYEPERGALFTADTIFAGGILGGIFASGNISDYIYSLRRLKEFHAVSLYPGHGRMSTNPQADLERAIAGSTLLMGDTRNLFESIRIHDSFKHIVQATVDYSRRAAERRQTERVNSSLEGMVRLDDADHPVTVLNLSLTGARLDREIALPPGARVPLAIAPIADLECEVVSHLEGQTRLRFLRAAPDYHALSDWLRANRQAGRRKG